MLKDVLQTYPQPIAYAYGNIHRASSEPERLDLIMRCAEGWLQGAKYGR